MITYPLDIPPSPGFKSFTFTPQATVAVTQSPSSGKMQVQRFARQLIGISVQLPPMTRDEAEQWNSFLLKLNGKEGTFLIGDPAGKIPKGGAAGNPGTPLVKGAAQTANQLVIDGVPASVTGYLKAGDYIQLGSLSTARIYKVLDDADSNASGEVTLTIWPDLRSSPADNETVIVSDAKGRFRLTSNEMPWSVDEAALYDVGFSAIEAI